MNGPNRIGQPDGDSRYYGDQTLDNINARLAARARQLGHDIEFFVGNTEDALVARVHQAKAESVGVVILNPTRLTGRGFALRDAFTETGLPMIEVHLSNIFRRQAFRHPSLFSDLAQGLVTGLGDAGYDYALESALRILDDPDGSLHDY